MVGHSKAHLGKGLVYAPAFIPLVRICLNASSFIVLVRNRVCFIVLNERIHHHCFGPCLQIGEPSERDGPLETLSRNTRQTLSKFGKRGTGTPWLSYAAPMDDKSVSETSP